MQELIICANEKKTGQCTNPNKMEVMIIPGKIFSFFDKKVKTNPPQINSSINTL